MIEYVIVLTMVLVSGSIWGWAIPWINYILGILIICWFLYKKIISTSITGVKARVTKRNTIIFIFIFIVYLFNTALVSHINPLVIWQVLLVITACYIICETIDQSTFWRKYINIVLILAVTSLIFWTLARFGIVISANIVEPGNGIFYLMNPFYIYRDYSGYIDNGLNARNFGIFWEGGAFQAFLNLALLFLIKEKKIYQKKLCYFYIKAFILIITIVTTFSTAGYLLMIFNVYFYMIESTNAKLTKKKFYMIIAFIIMGLFIINSSAVTDKFSSTSDKYISYLIRINDNLNGIKAAFVSPILGLGFNSEQYTRILSFYDITANSSGLLIIIQQFGIPFGLWYTINQCTIFAAYFKDRKIFYKLLSCGFLLLIFACESLNQNAIFMLFAFHFVKNNGTRDANN